MSGRERTPPEGGRVVLRGGSVIAGDGSFVRRDIVVEGGSIARIDAPGSHAPDTAGADLGGSAAPTIVIDCRGRVVLPGFVDMHSHAGSRVFDADVQLALLRQGVTTIITGQDGVSPAPGDGTWANEYFAAIDGPHPTYRGGGIGELLASADGTTPINVATLVPAGTVRHEVRGDEPGPSTSEQIAAMRALVRAGLDDGAVGLATGLDYVPGLFSDTDELTALCQEAAAVDGLHVSHMRGGYEANARAGLDEIAAIQHGSGVRAHVSHLHAPVDLVMDAFRELARAGARMTFDAYPYSRGCTILSMLLLPPEVASPGTDALAAAIRTPEGRTAMRTAILERVTARADLGVDWASAIMLSHVPAERHRHHQGRTLAEAAVIEDSDPATLAIDILVAARLQVTAIMRVPHARTPEELAPLYRLDAHMAGSDGIFVGTHPHPRAYGTFATYLADFTRAGLLTWPQTVEHLSTNAVRTLRLGDRGVVRVGAVADLVVVDPDEVAPRSTYEEPLGLAVGIDDALVAGVPVLRDGELTGATPGRGIRRQ